MNNIDISYTSVQRRANGIPRIIIQRSAIGISHITVLRYRINIPHRFPKMNNTRSFNFTRKEQANQRKTSYRSDRVIQLEKAGLYLFSSSLRLSLSQQKWPIDFLGLLASFFSIISLVIWLDYSRYSRSFFWTSLVLVATMPSCCRERALFACSKTTGCGIGRVVTGPTFLGHNHYFHFAIGEQVQRWKLS